MANDGLGQRPLDNDYTCVAPSVDPLDCPVACESQAPVNDNNQHQLGCGFSASSYTHFTHNPSSGGTGNCRCWSTVNPPEVTTGSSSWTSYTSQCNPREPGAYTKYAGQQCAGLVEHVVVELAEGESVDVCKAACDQTANCVAVVHVMSGQHDTGGHGTCYNRVGAANPPEAYTQDSRDCYVRGAFNGCTSLITTCNGADTTSGTNLGEGTAHAGGHLTATAAECCALCRATDGCIHYAYATSGEHQGVCWLKDHCVVTKECDMATEVCGAPRGAIPTA